MLTIIYLLNNKDIKYAHILLLGVAVCITNSFAPHLLSLFILDIYVLLLITQFNILKPKYNFTKSNIKVDITTEGIQKDERDIKSIFLNYINKFN